MVSINLYKIENKKNSIFEEALNKYYEPISEKSGYTILYEEEDKEYSIVIDYMLYYSEKSDNSKELSWNWILELFEEEKRFCTNLPKAILYIKFGVDVYAISFGYSSYFIDRYCDFDFPFEIAARLKYENIKTTALTSPNSIRNKIVNTYVNFDSLDFDSGESLNKIKAQVSEDYTKSLISKNIEFGSSIKVNLINSSLDSIGKLINYFKFIIDNKKIQTKIPYYRKITEQEKIKVLDERLIGNITSESLTVDISELNVSGTRIIFNDDCEYVLKYGRRISDKIIDLQIGDVIKFGKKEIEENINNFLKVKVHIYKDDSNFYTKSIKDIITFTDDSDNCILNNGIWYEYNNDYLQYLKDSLDEIGVKYMPEYNLKESEYKAYIEEKYLEFKEKDEYKGKAKKDVLKSLKTIFYKERYFNDTLVKRGYINFDRNLEYLNKHKYEVMDLYKESCMFAVKRGSTSGKLAYTVDQSIITLNLIKHKEIKDLPNVQYVVIWLVFPENKMKIIGEVKPELHKLNLLILKNKIDYWKKQVLLSGYKPLIYVNYEISD